MSVTPPKKPRRTTKGTPATAAQSAPPTANTSKRDSEELVPLNFAVPAEFHKDYKLFATMHGMKMVDVLKQSFELLKQQNN